MRPQSAYIDSGVRGGGCYGKHLEGSRQSIQPAENSMSHARHSSCVRCALERQQSIEGGNCLLPLHPQSSSGEGEGVTHDCQEVSLCWAVFTGPTRQWRLDKISEALCM